MDNTQQLIDKLTNAISFKFKDDGTRPNLTISRLRHGYYCSVVRYPSVKDKATKSIPSKNKIVVCKAEADDLNMALTGVADAFLTYAGLQQDPIQELTEVVRKNK